jgi:aminopeptidase N
LIEEQAKNATNETDLWWIPINFSFDGSDFQETKPDVWFPQEFEMTVDDPVFADQTRWVIMNAKTTGFYRCNYDTRNWELIRIGIFLRFRVC